MARIEGVDLPRNKRIEIALTYIYGIGITTAKKVLEKAEVDPNTRVRDLSDANITSLRAAISENLQVEGDLRRIEGLAIKRLVDIGCYRGRRHRLGLPLRGQRTRTNARTRRGGKRTVAGKKKAPRK
uniref:Ribosomal protein S13 n=1 Tax=Bangiopsis subsimplex TaxID=139980 RepID=A0A1C9CD18_9RHOD|nr:ribosomal protein S13 [Bangiopsis subsimplex]AOM66257.1 ribosomal protein S13 [Bangiopsis subsimplex]ARO90381.1 30S ribosomal protein S13 [Bangiopsis subsimplex]